MRTRVREFLVAWLLLGAGCGGRTASLTGNVSEGGRSESGGSPSTGGAATGGTVIFTGGTPTGGTPTGGSPTGGTPTGGSPTGGTPTGGTPTGGSPTGGTPTGGSPTGGTPIGGASVGGASGGTGNVGAQPNECSGYMNLWKIRQSALAPLGTEPTPGSDPACFDCFMEAGCERPSGSCAAGNVCLDRHCFCTPSHTVPPSPCLATDYPSNLCECVDTCFPAQKSCADQWRKYMQCVESACTSECL